MKLLKNISVAATAWLVPAVAFADIQKSIDDVKNLGTQAGVKEFTSFPDLLTEILAFLLGFVAIAAVIVLVYAGFKYITALGDENKAAEAKHTILYVVIGLVVIGAAGLITNAVIKFFLKP